MPPPNANDPLHIGHAMFVTIEDILIRYHRMKGEAALWLPGADHAGIETQFVFERKLKKQDKSRFDFDRQTLYQMIWDYVSENASVAKDQMKRIGASADWGRFKFTLDPAIVQIVLETFKKLHADKLLYRDLRLINYCTRCGTGFSDLEAKHELRVDPMLYIKYGPFTIATVRPETKFRDTALAVNPNDKRYKKYLGQTFDIPGLLGPITMKVIADAEVDPEFGTGIMKVTPAHDFHDFELGQKYGLPMTPIIDFKGKMDFSWFIDSPHFAKQSQKYQDRAKQYHGLHVSKARPLMIQHLKDDGLLLKIDEKYEHTVSVCYRCGTLLEPLPLPQFFITVKPLVEKALAALDKKEVEIYGSGHDKILRHWLENLKDWNISRQIVWGIRLPIWYDSQKHPDIHVSFLDPQKNLLSGTLADFSKKFSLNEIKNGLQNLKAPIKAQYVLSTKSPGENFIQETDTFDTWFSSAQWPYATLLSQSEVSNFQFPISDKMKKKYKDFDRFYPTSIMETGYDILPFWVMRMLMMGLYATGKVPFAKVYLHGLVRDEKGQKMSKSKGNVLNPLDVIEKYGADSLRMALVMSTTAGQDSATGEGKIRGMRNFSNKIWNAARFVITNLEVRDQKSKVKSKDEEFYKKLNAIILSVTQQLDDLKIGLAAETVYNEFWHWFCDQAIEQCKNGEISTDELEKGLIVFLKLLHPFVPFVTEEIWQILPSEMKKEENILMTARWAKTD